MAEAVQETLTLLERRLARIEFHLKGNVVSETNTRTTIHETVNSRVNKLEKRFSELCSGCAPAEALMRLREIKNYSQILTGG